MFRSSLPLVLAGAIALTGLLLAAPVARAQGSPFDGSGDLLRLPFEPELPVTRTETRQEGRDQWHLTYLSSGYDSTIEHYQRQYRERIELAPGWLISGYGFDNGADAYTFTLRYNDQLYFLQVVPNPGGGAVLRIRARGHGVVSRPYLHSVAPYRPSDLPAMPYNSVQ